MSLEGEDPIETELNQLYKDLFDGKPVVGSDNPVNRLLLLHLAEIRQYVVMMEQALYQKDERLDALSDQVERLLGVLEKRQ